MRQTFKLLAVSAVMAALLPVHATAQTAVPLEPSLLQWTWVVTDFPGKTDGSMAPSFFVDGEGEVLTGKTACGNDWWADVEIDFPKVKISDVQATAYDCADAKDVTKFLNILETADRFHTSSEGLEVLDQHGRRLLLMVSGG